MVAAGQAFRQRTVRGLLAVALGVVLVACGSDSDQGPGPVREVDSSRHEIANPLEQDYSGPFFTPPFHEIEARHFPPAMTKAVDQATERIKTIAGQSSPPDFANTITALIDAERDVVRIARLWYGLDAVSGEQAMAEAEAAMTEQLDRYRRALINQPELFRRIEAVRHNPPQRPLSDEDQRLLAETWRRLRRAGAHLDDDRRQKLAELDERIADVDRAWAKARRAATHRHELLIEDPARLAELPDSLTALARRTARDRGHDQGWAFTLHAHSFYPFMRHFPGRAERRELYQAWMSRYRDSRRSDENLGRLAERLAMLRARRADLLGFDSHLDYMLDDAWLDNGELRSLLDRLGAAARAGAREELERLRELAAADGIDGELAPWDWWYYRQRLAEQEFGTGSDDLHQWFQPEHVRDGLFTLAGRLWGLTFRERSELPAWHLDATAFEVSDADGETLGLLYFDLIHRRGKHGGAWTSHYRLQHYENGRRATPVVAIVTNMPPGIGGQSAGLSPEQIRTVFHEFGHAVHSLLSDVEHAALAGTNVAPDFVEFPGTLFEHWALAPELMSHYARPHEAGVVFDAGAAEQLRDRQRLTAGLEMLELAAAIELDIALHGARAGEVPKLEAAEREVREKLELPPMLSPRHHGGGLASLFANRRSGGDFRSLWSRVLAADAFSAFQQAGLFDRPLADRLRSEILERGNARPAAASWQAFRGRAPRLQFLLEERGLPDPQAAANTPGGE